MDLAVVDALFSADDGFRPGVELPIALLETFLRLRHLQAALLKLGLELGSHDDGLLARLDLRLTACGLGLPLGLGQQRPALVFGEAQPRRARGPQPDPERRRADCDSEQCRNDREHGRSLWGLSRGVSRGCSHPASACTGGFPVTGSCERVLP